MAEKVIVSPGVFTRERDLSYLPQGISEIGAAIIGPTTKGPAFVPTLVTSYEDFKQKFGAPDGNSYVPYTVKNYLKDAGRATIVRVTGLYGYDSDAITYELRGFVNNLDATVITSGKSATITTASGQTGVYNVSINSFTTPLNASLISDFNVSGSGITTVLTNLTTITDAGAKILFVVSGTLTPGALGVSASYAEASQFTSSLFVLAPTSSGAQLDSAVTFSTISRATGELTINYGTYTGSLTLDPSKPNYIANVFNSDPLKSNKPFYLYSNYYDTHNSLYNNGTCLINSTHTAAPFSYISGTVQINLSGSTEMYSSPSTPWVKSQTISGDKYNLFKFNMFTAGSPDVKISISDIKLAGTVQGSDYGTFTILVRDITDTDSKPTIIEQYTNVTLDPTSANYVARMIGDMYRTITSEGKVIEHGDFDNKSKYIYVECGDGYPATAIPFGFAEYTHPVSTTGTVYNFPAIDFVTTQKGTYDWNLKTYLGFDFVSKDNLSFIQKPAVDTTMTSATFSLEDCYIADSTDNEVLYVASSSLQLIGNRKFTVAFQCGYDGMNPTIVKNIGTTISAANVGGFNCTNSRTEGSVAYRKAISAISNPDEFDINMILAPGILYELHGNVSEYINTVCEDRGDCFHIVDPAPIDYSVASVVAGTIAQFDTSYSATYYPWVKIVDADNNKNMWVPPSVVMGGVIAFSDKVAAEWWAPAGLNRGGITQAVQIYNRLTQDERDSLYTARINPIATFVGVGIAAWGQKTLQVKASALDRISVRRLLIAVKKYISSTSRYLNFENNTAETRAKFLSIANPYFENIQQRQGLYAFRVIMDESNNTPDLIDRGYLYGQIYLQPAKSSEFILLDFNVTRTGASFTA